MTHPKRASGAVDTNEGDVVTQSNAATVAVPLLTLDALYRAATSRDAHTYFEGYTGRKHSIACAACDAIADVGRLLDAQR